MKNIKIFSNILAGCQFKYYSRYNANRLYCLLQVDGQLDLFSFVALQIFSSIADKR